MSQSGKRAGLVAAMMAPRINVPKSQTRAEGMRGGYHRGVGRAKGRSPRRARTSGVDASVT
jgi:hypothetical protein